MPFWFRWIVLYAVLCAAVIWLLGLKWDIPVALAIGFIPAIVNQTPALALRWYRLKFWLLNPETSWDLTLRFSGPFTAESVERVVHRLALEHPESSVLQSTDARFLLRYRRLFTIEFLVSDPNGPQAGILEPEAEETSVDVVVFDQQVSFRGAKRMLEGVLLPLVEQLKGAFTAQEGSYSFRVRFTGANPFFGVYLQGMNPERVRDFRFEFVLPDARTGEYVRVSRDSMTMSARSVQGLRQSVQAGLTFSAAGR